MESSTMYSMGRSDAPICGACGVREHFKEKNWTLVGYPKWHPKFKNSYKGRELGDNSDFQGRNQNGYYNKARGSKVAANAQGSNQ